jgi:hypothetical protein
LCNEEIEEVPYVIKEGANGEVEEAAHVNCWFGLKKLEQDEPWWKDGGHETAGVRS